ncbi:RES domain-containing protein [Thalassospira xiamenensis M-5 = DSM 17429]|nr:RES domain-containing protein [Thalassospira xiamenensis]SIT21278.1 RES domain-containing protein [Thalassospira xiamenensis M-5 = DSM 17429]
MILPLPSALTLCSAFKETVYRLNSPQWSWGPTSGDGAKLHGGRFNRPKEGALYTSTAIQTAVLEAAQGMLPKIVPTTLCCYETDFDKILDLTSPDVCNQLGISNSDLNCPWRAMKMKNQTPPSWEIADDLKSQGIQGILVNSFAPHATTENVNLVLWDWSDAAPNRIVVYDPHGALPKNQDSWK